MLNVLASQLQRYLVLSTCVYPTQWRYVGHDAYLSYSFGMHIMLLHIQNLECNMYI